MRTWWKPKNKWQRECIACLAGSVMRWSLERPLEVGIEVMPGRYDDATAARLDALNELRCGDVARAAVYMGLQTTVRDRLIYWYDQENPAPWWKEIKQLLADLRAAGE